MKFRTRMSIKAVVRLGWPPAAVLSGLDSEPAGFNRAARSLFILVPVFLDDGRSGFWPLRRV
jgi:hypothetical protein